jgi:hypothetical protein
MVEDENSGSLNLALQWLGIDTGMATSGHPLLYKGTNMTFRSKTLWTWAICKIAYCCDENPARNKQKESEKPTTYFSG